MNLGVMQFREHLKGLYVLYIILIDVILMMSIAFKLLEWLKFRYKEIFWKGITIVFLVSLVGMYFYFRTYEQTFYLNHIPQEMGVTKILYQKTDSWGFGPGGNETGVVVFELPENSAKTIESAGRDFFNVISKEDTPRNEYIRKCGDWQESHLSDTNTSWTLGSFLNQYGFGVTVDQDIENEINLAASTKGSYSTGCAGGAVIIVAPKIKKVFFVYAG